MAFALITGASGGIGLALAKELASRKHDVLLVARSAETLQKHCDEIRQHYGVKADYFANDLAVPGASIQVTDWVKRSQYAVDILVNNAGFASCGPFDEIEEKEFKGMMQLNMVTLTELCRSLLPELRRHPKGYILNVASTAAYQAVPTLTVYAATKGFVLLMTRGLRLELRGTSVSASCLSPGPTTTGFIERAKLQFMQKRADQFSMKPEAVAKAAIDGLFAGKAEIIPGITNWLSSKLAEIVPKAIPEGIAKNLYKKG